MKQTPEQPPEPIVLRVNTIADGKFYAAGSETPFTEETLPEHLRPDIAVGDEDFYDQSERNIYYGSPGLRGRARRILSNVQWLDANEDAALEEQKLPEETEAALRDAAERNSALGKAQLQYDRDATDNLHEELARAREPQRMFLKRGAVFVDVEKTTPRPAEHVFVKRPSGYESIGIVDADGQLPPEEIIP